MKRISILIFLAAILLALAGSSTAQSPDKILKQAAKALGGEKALKAVRSRSFQGKITRLQPQASDNSTGSFRLQAVSPNSYYISYDLNGFETAAGYNGKTAWQRNSRTGARTLTGDTGRDFQAEAAYHSYSWLNYKTEKAKIAAGGIKQIDGKNCSTVFLTTPKGVRITFYFDSQTALPVREEYPAADGVKTFDYGDFRKVDGVLEPFSIKMSIAGDSYRIGIDEVLHNKVSDRTVFDFPQISLAPLPKIPELLEQVRANQDRLEQMREEYTFTETMVGKEIGKDGALKELFSQTSQITFYKGSRISRQIELNGKPLTEKQQEKEDKRVADEIEDLEKKLAKQEKKGEDDGSSRISIAEILRASNLINPRRETFRGREVIVFDFEPNPAFNLKNAKSILKLFGNAAGVIWIDEKDKQVARMEAYLADSVSFASGIVKLRKGASFSMEQDRINDEIWLPLSSDINISARVFLVTGMDLNQTTRYGNYKKFKTEVKDAKVDAVKEH
jgi:outer membrane lipoprotein-sorting protein/gas vesicle protein